MAAETIIVQLLDLIVSAIEIDVRVGDGVTTTLPLIVFVTVAVLTARVQPENIDRMAAVIQQDKAAARSFLIVEQNLGLVELTADRAYLLDHGDCVYEASNGPDLRAQLSDRMQI